MIEVLILSVINSSDRQPISVKMAQNADHFGRKNTIRDGGSTALYAAFTVDTVYTIDLVYTVDMFYTVVMVYTVNMVSLLTWFTL